MRSIIIQAVLFLIYGISYGQKNATIISCPSMEDIHSLEYVEAYVNEVSARYKDTVITIFIDAIGVFEIKEFNSKIKFDTTLFYCPKQYRLIKSILSKKNVKLYGTSITSDMFDYLKNSGNANYKQLDSLAMIKTGKSFRTLFISKTLTDYPIILNKLITNFNLDAVESRIVLSCIKNMQKKTNNLMTDSTFSKMLAGFDYFLWVNEWTDNIPFSNTIETINIIPHKLGIDDINAKNYTNKLKNVFGMMDYSELNAEQLPKKIKINDFLTVKREDILPCKNIYINTTSSCRKK